MEVVGLARRGDLGSLRLFTSSFTQLVRAGDVRLSPLEKGGGTVYDLGVYCINAARHLFAAEPVEVIAHSARGPDPRFRNCDETTSATLVFPGGRLATFTSSFGAGEISSYWLAGTDGVVRMDPAYYYAVGLAYELQARGQERRRRETPQRDQFAPQLIYLSRCIRDGRDPEPDGWEGLADVRVIRAVHRSAREGRSISLEPLEIERRPGPRQVITRPGIDEPSEVAASGPKERAREPKLG
jgi:predicted dehydrogenase